MDKGTAGFCDNYGNDSRVSVLPFEHFDAKKVCVHRNFRPTVAGKMMEKHSDLFIVQWESQKKHYKKAVYGGCLY